MYEGTPPTTPKHHDDVTSDSHTMSTGVQSSDYTGSFGSGSWDGGCCVGGRTVPSDPTACMSHPKSILELDRERRARREQLRRTTVASIFTHWTAFSSVAPEDVDVEHHHHDDREEEDGIFQLTTLQKQQWELQQLARHPPDADTDTVTSSDGTDASTDTSYPSPDYFSCPVYRSTDRYSPIREVGTTSGRGPHSHKRRRLSLSWSRTSSDKKDHQQHQDRSTLNMIPSSASGPSSSSSSALSSNNVVPALWSSYTSIPIKRTIYLPNDGAGTDEDDADDDDNIIVVCNYAEAGQDNESMLMPSLMEDTPYSGLVGGDVASGKRRALDSGRGNNNVFRTNNSNNNNCSPMTISSPLHSSNESSPTNTDETHHNPTGNFSGEVTLLRSNLVTPITDERKIRRMGRQYPDGKQHHRARAGGCRNGSTTTSHNTIDDPSFTALKSRPSLIINQDRSSIHNGEHDRGHHPLSGVECRLRPRKQGHPSLEDVFSRQLTIAKTGSVSSTINDDDHHHRHHHHDHREMSKDEYEEDHLPFVPF